MFRRRNHGQRPPTYESAQLIAETEAFLAGDYVDHLWRRGMAAPGWAWLNRLAHGDVRSIGKIRRSAAVSSAAWEDSRDAAWTAAQRVLAMELLDLVNGDPEALFRVQQRALIPLELQLIGAEADSGLTAFELVWSARSALRSSLA